MVNYLSLFCADLLTLLKPIVKLTRKGRPFIWGLEQDKVFKEVKKRLPSPPVLHLPCATGCFIFYTDTSIEGTGSSLWQIQEGEPCLIGYASKTLPEACARYSVTELEMTGLLVNIGLWRNILKHREFDVAVDHVAVTQILKAKTEPASARIMRLLDRLSSYSFNLYYVKGRDMVLADYLSRHRISDKDPSELILISFCPMAIYNYTMDHATLHVATRASNKASGEAPPKVHSTDKALNPHVKPEHQVKVPTPKKASKAQLAHIPNQPQVTPQEVVPETSHTLSCQLTKRHQHPKTMPLPEQPQAQLCPSFHTPQASRTIPRSIRPCNPPEHPPLPITTPHKDREEDDVPYRIETKYTSRKYALDLKPDPGTDTGDCEEVLGPEIKIPFDTDFIMPPSLENVVDVTKITHKFLPKQGEVERLIKQINRKVLRDTKLPGSLKDLKAAYLTSPHFKDIYLNLLQKRAPLNKSAVKHLENNARQYMIVDGLLFKLVDSGRDEPDTVLCIPTSRVHVLLDFFHNGRSCRYN